MCMKPMLTLCASLVCKGAPKRGRDGKEVSLKNSAASWLSEAARVFGTIFAGKHVGWEDLCTQAVEMGVSNGELPSCADASCMLANPAHVDLGDGAPSFAVWTLKHANKVVKGWWFLVRAWPISAPPPRPIGWLLL
jgi:hypothetical protein